MFVTIQNHGVNDTYVSSIALHQHETLYDLLSKTSWLEPAPPLTQLERETFEAFFDYDFSPVQSDSVEQNTAKLEQATVEASQLQYPNACVSPDADKTTELDSRCSKSSCSSPELTGDLSPSITTPYQTSPESTIHHFCPYEGCQSHFTTDKYLRRHLKLHTRPRLCPQLDCNARLPGQKEIDRHLAQVHQVVSHHFNQCPTPGCQKHFGVRRDALRRHLKSERHIKKFGLHTMS